MLSFCGGGGWWCAKSFSCPTQLLCWCCVVVGVVTIDSFQVFVTYFCPSFLLMNVTRSISDELKRQNTIPSNIEPSKAWMVQPLWGKKSFSWRMFTVWCVCVPSILFQISAAPEKIVAWLENTMMLLMKILWNNWWSERQCQKHRTKDMLWVVLERH